MGRVIAAVGGGVLLGVLVTLAAVRMGPSNISSPGVVARDIDDVPQMAPAVAEKHRDEQYASLDNIKQVLALPTEFARSEAVYVLAGRSSSAEVQNLIFEANRIADEVERVNLLNTLFFRLAEEDPKSALALARTDQFKTVRSIEQTVWRAWARKDLDEALFAAKTQTTSVQQNRAAQSLYAAFGYMENETTDRIETELGIVPNRSARARYLYLLADSSTAEAIEFINSLDRDNVQSQYVNWLAYYVSLSDPAGALQYASLFDVDEDGERYTTIIQSHIAEEDPKATIERIMASGENVGRSSEFRSAAYALASTDLDAAVQYFAQMRSVESRRYLGTAIVEEMAKNDPLEAVAWARANEKGEFAYLQMSALSQIAKTDSQLALSEALKTPNIQMRSMLLSSIMQRVARTNPADAVAYLDQIPNRQQRLEASGELAKSWIQHDPDAALDWILSQDEETSAQMLPQVGFRLLRNNLDAAVRLLPRLDGATQSHMRQQIAQQLAADRSVQAAREFIRQFEGEPDYAQLQASVIAGVAKTDVLMARQLADQLADENSRNKAYVQIVSQHAASDPAAAMQLLDNISNEDMRGAAVGQVARQWVRSDPVAATRWASNLPSGPTRDDAIMHLSQSWGEMTAEKEALIASIEDRDKRGQAKVRQVYQLMRTDPAKAREILADTDLPSYLREQAETIMAQQGM